MSHDYDHIAEDAVMLETRIPESGTVEGLEYGAFISHGWNGYYVRPEGTDTWGVARMTPAADELPEPEDEDETQDEAILRSIREEME